MLGLLAACGKVGKPPVGVDVLNADAHIEIADQAAILPIVAIRGYATAQQAYALSTQGDSADSAAEHARFLREARDATAPRRLSRLSMRIGMDGAADTGAQWHCGHSCPARVYGAVEGRYHTVVVRLGGEPGAIWTVPGEWIPVNPLRPADRHGRAIALFVTAALGRFANYAALRLGMPGLRRPGGQQEAFFAGRAVRATDGEGSSACVNDAASISAVVP